MSEQTKAAKLMALVLEYTLEMEAYKAAGHYDQNDYWQLKERFFKAKNEILTNPSASTHGM